MPEGVLVPIVVPPDVHVDGAKAEGPNTLNVITAPEPVPDKPDIVAAIAEAGSAVPFVAVAGAAVIVNSGEASDTTVFTVGGQSLLDAPLPASPGQLTYHQ